MSPLESQNLTRFSPLLAPPSITSFAVWKGRDWWFNFIGWTRNIKTQICTLYNERFWWIYLLLSLIEAKTRFLPDVHLSSAIEITSPRNKILVILNMPSCHQNCAGWCLAEPGSPHSQVLSELGQNQNSMIVFKDDLLARDVEKNLALYQNCLSGNWFNMTDDWLTIMIDLINKHVCSHM